MFEIILNILCLGVSAYLIGTGFLHIIKFPATKPVFTRGGEQTMVLEWIWLLFQGYVF